MAAMAIEWWRNPWALCILVFGLAILVLAVIETFAAKVYGKWGCDKSCEEPRWLLAGSHSALWNRRLPYLVGYLSEALIVSETRADLSFVLSRFFALPETPLLA
jgi:hypothetical protein